MLALALLLIMAAGCGEQISSTRLPGGALRNFFTHLQHGELEDALAYWAPDFTPANARARTDTAIRQLRGYVLEVTRADTQQNADGSIDGVLRGRLRPVGGAWQEDQELMRVHLITRGPGWRVTDFTLVCCP